MIKTILIILIILFVIFRVVISLLGNWQLTIFLLAESYIRGIEEEKLSPREAFLKTLKLRYETKKTSQLVEELESKGVSESEIETRVLSLNKSNYLLKDDEYRYEYILERKGFFQESTDLKFSRSLIEGGMNVSESVKSEMNDLYFFNDRGFIKDGDFSLLELLVCGMMINYSYSNIKNKDYNQVVGMIKTALDRRPYYKKYL